MELSSVLNLSKRIFLLAFLLAHNMPSLPPLRARIFQGKNFNQRQSKQEYLEKLIHFSILILIYLKIETNFDFKNRSHSKFGGCPF